MAHTVSEQEAFKSLQYLVPKVKGFLASLHDSSPPLIFEEFPLHSPGEMEELKKMWRRSLIPWKGIKVEKIRHYFGGLCISCADDLQVSVASTAIIKNAGATPLACR